MASKPQVSHPGLIVLPLEPRVGLSWIVAEVDHAAERDPQIGEAVALLTQRLDGLSDADRTAFAAIVWSWLRAYIGNNPFADATGFGTGLRFLVNGLPASLLAIRLGLADGAAIRRLAIDSLETTLQQDALTQITDQVAEWASDDDRRAQFQVIQDEVLAVSNQHGTTDSPVAVAAAAFVAGFVVGTLASEIYHHHIKHHDH